MRSVVDVDQVMIETDDPNSDCASAERLFQSTPAETLMAVRRAFVEWQVVIAWARRATAVGRRIPGA
jgi:hypothetical protein